MAKKKEEVVVEETQVEVTPTANQDGLPSRGYRSPGNLIVPVAEAPVVAEDGGQEEA
jgi:hypothetical protein